MAVEKTFIVQLKTCISKVGTYYSRD